MPLPYRSMFQYGENIVLALTLPITPWLRHTGAVGGDIEADSGVRAAYVVRRDEFLTFTLRFFEDEWPDVQFLLDYGQTGQLIVWYPDQDHLDLQFACYLEAPAIGTPYAVTPDGEYPRVFLQEITLVRSTWNLPPWNNPDAVPPPAGPTGWVIHYFTYGNTIFTVLAGSGLAEVLIVGGGGSGGSVDGTGCGAGGGGAGGLIHDPALFLSAGVYPVQAGTGAQSNHADHTLGGGGFGVIPGNNGGESFFGDIAAQGGGGGGAGAPQAGVADLDRRGKNGGSGGGGASSYDYFDPPPGNNNGGQGIPPQGNDGGAGLNVNSNSQGGGGGGAGGTGALGTGGTGRLFDLAGVDGALTMYAQGGTARMGMPDPAVGYGGGGGGGHATDADGTTGNSGIVIVKYPIESGIIAVGGVRVEYLT
jgi:hypothetical protein